MVMINSAVRFSETGVEDAVPPSYLLSECARPLAETLYQFSKHRGASYGNSHSLDLGVDTRHHNATTTRTQSHTTPSHSPSLPVMLAR